MEDGQAFAYRRFLGQCDAKAYLNAEVRVSRRRTRAWRVTGGITRPRTSVAAELPLDPVEIQDPFLGAGGTLRLSPGR